MAQRDRLHLDLIVHSIADLHQEAPAYLPEAQVALEIGVTLATVVGHGKQAQVLFAT